LAAAERVFKFEPHIIIVRISRERIPYLKKKKLLK